MALGTLIIGIFLALAVIRLLWKIHFPINYEKMNPLCQKHGPKLAPVIGLITPTGPRGSTAFIHKMEKDHSSPVITKLGPLYTTIIFDADNVERLLTDNNNTQKSFFYRFLWPWFGHGLLTSYGSRWHRQRKLLTPSFHFRILNDFVPVMNSTSLILVKRMREITEKQGGKPWDICHVGQRSFKLTMVNMAALDIIMETSMGSSINALSSDKHPYAEAIIRFAHYFNVRISKPWQWPDALYFLTPTGKIMRAAIDVLRSHSDRAIAVRRKRFFDTKESPMEEENDGIKTHRLAFLDHMLGLEAKGEFTKDETHEQVDTFMFEGHDTTSHGIMWALYCLARNPDHQEIVRQELNQLLGDDKSTCPTPDQLGKMYYLDMCIKETQRMYPSVPIIGRYLDKDFQLANNIGLVPAHSEVIVDFYALHRDEKYFPSPEKFDPQRFSNENSAGRHPFAYCPFAGGARNCIGQRFAMNEMRVVLSHLIRNFEFSTTQTHEETGMVYQMITAPLDGLWLTSKPL